MHWHVSTEKVYQRSRARESLCMDRGRFVRKRAVVVANRIFEMILYHLFLTLADAQQDQIDKAALQNKQADFL